jgi:hypothetical protein
MATVKKTKSIRIVSEHAVDLDEKVRRTFSDAIGQSAVERIAAYRDRAVRVLDATSDPKLAEHAQGAFEYFKWVVEDLKRIADPAARAIVEDVVLNLIRAFHHDWRAGIRSLKQPIEVGAKAMRQRREAGFSSGAQRAAERQVDWNRQQARANELHAVNPRRTKSDICAQIAREFGLTREGVARRVSLPTRKKVGTERPRSKE